MPPEQLLGETGVDRRADVFAVGVMMWEALAGHRMWRGLTEQKVLRALARAELPALREAAPDVPPELEAIVARALAPDREDRFSTAEEMQNALERAMSVTSGVVHPRELATFMQRNFGEHRQLQKQKLDEARRNPNREARALEYRPSSVFPTEQTTSAMTEFDEPRASGSVPAANAARSKKFRLALPLLLVALAALGFAATQWKKPAQVVTRAPQQESTEPVRIQVLTEPARAEIFLDGKRLGVGNYKGTHAFSRGKHRLETRATGYRPRDEWVSLDEDLIRLIRLDPLSPDALHSLGGAQRDRHRNAAREKSSAKHDADAKASLAERATALESTSHLASEAAASSASPAGSSPVSNASAVAPPAAATTTPPSAISSLPASAKAERAPLKPEPPKQLASKLGHARLTIDSNRKPYRVSLPPALDRMSRTFDARVSICVSTLGTVSSMKVLHSADPALDRQLAIAISRWLYRPLLEGGRAIPFCYNLRFEF
jgi:hypothetical protein